MCAGRFKSVFFRRSILLFSLLAFVFSMVGAVFGTWHLHPGATHAHDPLSASHHHTLVAHQHHDVFLISDRTLTDPGLWPDHPDSEGVKSVSLEKESICISLIQILLWLPLLIAFLLVPCDARPTRNGLKRVLPFACSHLARTPVSSRAPPRFFPA